MILHVSKGTFFGGGGEVRPHPLNIHTSVDKDIEWQVLVPNQKRIQKMRKLNDTKNLLNRSFAKCH